MKIYILSLILLATSVSISAQIKCTVEGIVVDRPYSKQMYLTKFYDDFRSNRRLIDIKNGKFEFTITDPDIQCYKLVFAEELNKGAYRTIDFCTTDGTMQMTLYPKADFKKNRIIGSLESEKMIAWRNYEIQLSDSLVTPFYNQLETIPDEEQLNDYGRSLKQQIDTTKNKAQLELLYELWQKKKESGEVFTPHVRAINASLDSAVSILLVTRKKAEFELLPIYCYSNLICKLSAFNSYSSDNFTIESVETSFKKYAEKYPEHSYTKVARELIDAIRKMRIGGKFVDFTAPDLNGRMVKISSVIKGEIAIIDLWGSWCGPCRKNSKSLIPIYNEYKDRGFTIVGVARERNNDKAMRKAIEQDGYKWLNLVEINDKSGIWKLYGAANGAGKMVMVDKNGTILAIDPTAEEIRKILKTKIK